MALLGGIILSLSLYPVLYWILMEMKLYELSIESRPASVDIIIFGLSAMTIYWVKGRWERFFMTSAFISMLVSYQKPWIKFAVAYWFAISFGLLAAQKMRNWFMDDKRRDQILKLVLFAASMNAVWVIVQMLNIDLITVPSEGAHGEWFYTGFFGNPNDLGIFLAISLPLVFCCGKWSTKLFLFAFLGFALWIMQSTMSFLAAIVGLFSYLAFIGISLKNLVFILMVGTLAAVFFLIFVDRPKYSDLIRFRIMKRSAQIAMQKPLFGHGLASFAIVFAHNTRKEANMRDGPRSPIHVLNEYIETLFEQGFLGLFALFALMISVLKRSLKMPMSPPRAAAIAGLTALAANSLGFYPLHIPLLALMALIFYAIALSETKSRGIKDGKCFDH